MATASVTKRVRGEQPAVATVKNGENLQISHSNRTTPSLLSGSARWSPAHIYHEIAGYSRPTDKGIVLPFRTRLYLKCIFELL